MDATYRIDIERVFAERPLARQVIERLTAAGHEAVVVGGVVRDGVLSLLDPAVPFDPVEVDVATSALPGEVRRLMAGHTIVGIGEEFGVLLIVGSDEEQVEVATYRVEGEYDGRWPRQVDLVRDLAGDVARRDLTINGLAATPDGRVIDLVGGIDDLRVRRVRTIGDPNRRFAEDHLRMMRAIRFTCQIGGEIDLETAAAIVRSAPRIQTISWERIHDELLRILSTNCAARGVALLDEYGLLRFILPEVLDMKGVPQPEAYHPEGDVFVHTLKALEVADVFIRDPLVKLAVLLHDVGKPKALVRSGGANMGGHCAIGARIAKGIARRLRLSRFETARLLFLIKNHMRIADFPAMGRGKQVRFLSEGEVPGVRRLSERFPLFFDLLQLLVADCEASAHRSSGWVPILSETLKVADHIDHVCGLAHARTLIDGHTLREMGMTPGPRLGAILEQVHDRILAGEVRTRDSAIRLARALIDANGDGN